MEWLQKLEITGKIQNNNAFIVSVNTTMLIALKSFGFFSKDIEKNLIEKINGLFWEQISREQSRDRTLQQTTLLTLPSTEKEIFEKGNSDPSGTTVDAITRFTQILKNPTAFLKFSEKHIPTIDGGHFISVSNECSVLGLEDCTCSAFSRTENTIKKLIEEKILTDAISTFEFDKPLTYLSVGSGGLFTDWVILGKLLLAGFKNIQVSVVDRLFTLCDKNGMENLKKVQRFRESLEKFAGSKNATIRVKLYESVLKFIGRDLKARPQIVAAIDVPNELARALEGVDNAENDYYIISRLAHRGKVYLATHLHTLREVHEVDIPVVYTRDYNNVIEKLDVQSGIWN